MKARHIISVVLICLAMLTFASCSDAIFATVETATKTAENSLSLTLNVNDITVPVPGTYVVSAGAIFQGVLQGSYPGTVTWKPNKNDSSRPFSPSGTICNALAWSPSGTTLYGGFISLSDGTGSLYQSADGSYSFGSGHGTPIVMAASGEQITYLRAANTYLLVGGAVFNAGLNQYVYELDCWNGTTWTTPISGLKYPIVGAGWDGANYWALSSAFGLGSSSITGSVILYTGSGSPPTFSQVSSPVPTEDQANGIFVDGTNSRVFIATRLNGVYWSTNGGASWNNTGADHVGSVTVSSLCVAGPVDSLNGVVYLVGSDGYGYYSLSTASPSNGLSRFGDTTVLLYSSSVARIAVDYNTPINVLMGTNANGLWRGVFDATGNLASGESWIHE